MTEWKLTLLEQAGRALDPAAWDRSLSHPDDYDDAVEWRLNQMAAAERAFAVLASPPSPGVGEWRGIESAPRDGSHVVATVSNADGRWQHLNGRTFVVRHEGITASGFDLGWSIYPGLGGAPDCWFAHWMPLPPPPGGLGEDKGASNASRAADGDPARPATEAESSAVELLEALKGVVAIADRRTVEFDRARAAIAKAEGQS